ncbi:MAG: hypothetical protein J6R82_01710 [Clostridia bacterium]|nr:hypothetical protein [Clostridia bacterium]
MFKKNENIPENDKLQEDFAGMDRYITAPADLKEAAKSGIPLHRADVSRRVHIRRFSKAIAIYAVCAIILLGVAWMLPSLLKGNGLIPASSSVTDSDDVTVPDDFSFSIRFNVYGISSYDSATGKLVKTNDPHNENLEQYETTMQLSDEQIEEIYRLLSALDWSAYPDGYRPTDAQSTPCETWGLKMQIGNDLKIIECYRIPPGTIKGRDEKAQELIDTFVRIEEIITSTEEWKSLPDPEVLYI